MDDNDEDHKDDDDDDEDRKLVHVSAMLKAQSCCRRDSRN